MLCSPMRDEKAIFSQRITKDGVYDIKLLFSEIKHWYDSNDYDWEELGNVTKEKDKGIEVSSTLEGVKLIEDYYKRTIKVEFLITRINKVTVKDMKLDKAKVEIIITSYLTTDVKNLYHSAFGDFFKKLKDDYINFYEKKGQVGRLFVESQDLVATIKHALGMP